MILTIDQATQVPLFESLDFLKFKYIALISCLWNIFLAGNFEPKKQLNDVAGWGGEPKELLNLYQQDLLFPFSSCNFVFTFSTFLHFALISDLINRCGCTRSLHVKCVFSGWTLSVLWVFSECALSVLWVCSECTLSVLMVCSELNWSCCSDLERILWQWRWAEWQTKKWVDPHHGVESSWQR